MSNVLHLFFNISLNDVCEEIIFTLIFSLPLGLILAFGSLSKWRPLRYLIQILVWIIRGTPLMLQLIIIYYGPGLAANWAQALG